MKCTLDAGANLPHGFTCDMYIGGRTTLRTTFHCTFDVHGIVHCNVHYNVHSMYIQCASDVQQACTL